MTCVDCFARLQERFKERGIFGVFPVPAMLSDGHPHSPPGLKIAFTYDHKSEWLALGYSPEQCVEFDGDETIDGIANALRKLGTVQMVGSVRSLTKILAVSKPDWDIVFNISEGLGSIGREAQVPSLLEAWGILFTFSDAATLALCLDKAKTKMVAEHYGIPTAPFACIPPRNSWTADFDPLSAIYNSPHREALKTFPLFLKPAAEGTGMGITQANKAANQKQLLQVLEDLSRQYPTQTILIERFLAGREFTVSILGTGVDARVIGIRELAYLKDNPALIRADHDPAILEIEVYGQASKCPDRFNPRPLDIDLSHPLAQGAADVALKAWRILGCRDGGRVDTRYDTKEKNAICNLIEVNPLAGLGHSFSDLPLSAKANGIEYNELIGLFVESALKRNKFPFNAPQKSEST